jgi:hypothetical protein
MITVEKPYTVRTSGIAEEGVSFGIKQEGLSHIFNVLRNQLYSNKTLAVVREYSCNAYDAQVEAGKEDQKFIVSCPTFTDPVFSVRDFGSGLSPEGIAEVYAYYGESTKRNSNKLIGQLGLGSKSGFAYGDSFVIKSYYKGTLFIYNAFLDESKIGQIVKIAEQSTSESDGVEISIPVKPRDIYSFKENILAFFKYFKNKPIINNISKIELDNSFEEKAPTLGGDDWSFSPSVNSWENHPSLMVMGNVAYPIKGEDVEKLHSIFFKDFIVHFNIGDLEVSASRESLQFSSTTQKAILNRFSKILDDVKKQIDAKIKNAKSLFEAKIVFSSLTYSSGEFYRFQSLVGNITWNNIPISDEYIRPSHAVSKGFDLYEISKSRRSDRIITRKEDSKIIRCFSGSRFYVDDVGGRFANRLYHYVFNQNTSGISKIYVISFKSDVCKANFLKETGISESELNYVSKEKPNKITYAPSSSGGSGFSNAKHSTKEFKLNFQALRSYYRVKSDQFTEADFDLSKGGVYIHINKFFCKSYYDPNDTECDISASTIINLLNFSDSRFPIKFPDVACFKTETAEKVSSDKNWKSLKAYVKEYVEKNWTNGESQKIANYLEYQRSYSNLYSWIEYLSKIKGVKDIKSFVSLCNSFTFSKDKCLDDDIIEIFNRSKLLKEFTQNLQPTNNLEKEFSSLTKQFPILKALDKHDIEGAKIVEKYLQLQEKDLTFSV